MGALKPWHLAVLLIVIVVIALIVVLVIRTLAGGLRGYTDAPKSIKQPSAREILDMRLASGQITEDEYRRLRDALGKDKPYG